MELAERFRYIMKLNQLSASAFADEIGVQRSSISHILSGRNKPSLEFIQKILKRFPKIDASWLINGTTQIESSEINLQTSIEDLDSDDGSDKNSVSASDLASESGLTEDIKPSKGKIKKIVLFYTDHTFEEFTP